MGERTFTTTQEDPELEALEIIWAAIAELDYPAQRRIALATLRRASDEMRKADKEFADFRRLKAKFEPPAKDDNIPDNPDALRRKDGE